MDAERRRRFSKVYWNLRLFGLPEPVRDLWMLGLTILIVVTLTGQQSAIDRQREGRKTALEAVCGIEQATISAGRAQLLSSGHIRPVRFERNLVRLGYPPRAVRERQARVAAAGYSTLIARAVQRESGIGGLVGPDGQLRCGLLVRAGKAGR